MESYRKHKNGLMSARLSSTRKGSRIMLLLILYATAHLVAKISLCTSHTFHVGLVLDRHLSKTNLSREHKEDIAVASVAIQNMSIQEIFHRICDDLVSRNIVAFVGAADEPTNTVLVDMADYLSIPFIGLTIISTPVVSY